MTSAAEILLPGPRTLIDRMDHAVADLDSLLAPGRLMRSNVMSLRGRVPSCCDGCGRWHLPIALCR